MQKPQYTHDIAYKYSLWRKLLSDWRGPEERPLQEQPLKTSCDSGSAQETVLVSRAAFRIVQDVLPRRTYEPCCLCGSCFPPSRGSTTSTFAHTALHPGRWTIEPTEGVRDEECFCLAHSAACLSGAAALRLVLRGYRSSVGNGRDPWRGLRCLLRHVPLCEVAFLGIESSTDMEELLYELLSLLLLQQQRGSPSEHAEHSAGLSSLSLCKVAAVAPRSLEAFFRGAACVDSLTSFSLQYSSLADLSALATYVRGSARLRSLSLRGNKQVAEDGWSVLATAVASCSSLVYLDVSDCGWDSAVLTLFLQACYGLFVPRGHLQAERATTTEEEEEGFTWDLSDNPSLHHAWSLLSTHSSPELQQCLTGLSLAGNSLDDGDEKNLNEFFERFPALRSLNVGFCTMTPSCIQRLTRCLSEQGRAWERLDFQSVAPPMPVAVLKRLTQLAYRWQRGNAALLLCGVNLHDCVLKASFASCLGVLSEVKLSTCRLCDDDLRQLAAALEKAPVLMLRELRLGYNDLGTSKRKGESALSSLCKALRAAHAPKLKVLDLSHNSNLSLRPVLALVEQVVPSFKELVLTATPIAEDGQECAMLLSAVMRRQKGTTAAAAFASLDLLCGNSEGDLLITNRELLDWLWRQAAVRVISKGERL